MGLPALIEVWSCRVPETNRCAHNAVSGRRAPDHLAESPPVHTTLTRRGLLASAVLGLVAGAAGCTADAPPPPPVVPPPDELLGYAEAARRDAATATALAAVLPDRAPLLRSVGADRTAHADAFDAEVARAAGSVDGMPVTAAPTSTTVGGAPEVSALQVSALQGALRQAQDAAALAATTSPRHRAGLLGSVAAACAAQLAVLA